MRKYIPVLLLSVFVLGACSSWNRTTTGTVAGAGAGAALGAVIGGLIGHDGKSAAIGAAIGTAVGGGAGAIIGHKMDKKAEELAALNAKVETVTDANGLEAIKVTFDNGILFATNKATLSAQSQKELKEFAAKMADMPDTDVTVYGHTDNTGSLAVNQKLSKNRAEAVSDFLKSQGVAETQIKEVEGFDFQQPVASNDTKEGRAQNRRVEVFLYASDEMRAAAEAGTLEE